MGRRHGEAGVIASRMTTQPSLRHTLAISATAWLAALSGKWCSRPMLQTVPKCRDGNGNASAAPTTPWRPSAQYFLIYEGVKSKPHGSNLMRQSHDAGPQPTSRIPVPADVDSANCCNFQTIADSPPGASTAC